MAQLLPKPVEFPRLLQLVEEAIEQPLVLVVDDDHDLCENLWEILRSTGYRVGLAHDQSEALQQLEGADFKVVLIDMKLPGTSGKDIFRLVHERRPEAKTVLITGFRSEMDAVVAHVLAKGADAVCYKPFDVPGLLDALAKFTGQSESAGDTSPASSSLILLSPFGLHRRIPGFFGCHWLCLCSDWQSRHGRTGGASGTQRPSVRGLDRPL